MRRSVGKDVHNMYRSPFHQRWWPWLIFVWVIISFGLNSYNLISQIVG